MMAGHPLKSEIEFPVDDHIGAIAVATHRRILLGANWDTETVYVWDFEGRLKQTLRGRALEKRGLGVVAGSANSKGVAVQDWKFVGERLFASGLCASAGNATRSRWISFTNFLQLNCHSWSIALPLQQETELAREAMAVSDGFVHFLPEDLGASNRIFRVRITGLLKDSPSL